MKLKKIFLKEWDLYLYFLGGNFFTKDFWIIGLPKVEKKVNVRICFCWQKNDRKFSKMPIAKFVSDFAFCLLSSSLCYYFLGQVHINLWFKESSTVSSPKVLLLTFLCVYGSPIFPFHLKRYHKNFPVTGYTFA